MPLPSDFHVEAFLGEIDRDPNLKEMRVVYIDDNGTEVLRQGPLYCAEGLKAIVIRPSIEQTALQEPGASRTRDSKILREVLGATLSCSAAAIGWVVAAGSASATPLTGGASIILTYLAAGAATASSVQCVNGLARVATEAYAPEQLNVLDSQGWYNKVSLALDALSLAGAVASTAITIKLALQLHATTGKGMFGVLKGLSRQQRKKLAEEIVRIQNPGISKNHLRTMVRNGIFPKRLTNVQIQESVRKQLFDAAGAAFSYTGSAASDAVRQVFGIAQSVETY